MKLLNIDLHTAYGGGWINRVHNLEADKVRERISDAIDAKNIELEIVFRLADKREQHRAKLKIGRDLNSNVIFILGTIEQL